MALKITYVLATFCLAACCSCKQIADNMGSNVSGGFSYVIDQQRADIRNIETKIEIIAKENIEISKRAASIHLTSGLDPKISDHAKEIEKHSRDITKDILEIKQYIGSVFSSAEKMSKLGEDVKNLEKKIADLQKTAEILENENAKKLYEYIAFFWVAGFALIAGGLALAFLVNRMAGGSVALVGIIILGLASASQYYLKEIAQVGFAIVVAGMIGGIAFLIYMAWRSKRAEVAISEVVELVEEMKKDLTDEQLSKMFGDNGVAMNLYSNATKSIVDAKRSAVAKEDKVVENEKA